MGDEATNRPSPRAVARLAGHVGGEVADLRSSLRRALDEADRHTADGRPDRAAAVLADQQHLLEAVHRRLEERLAAAAVEREAEGVLADADPGVAAPAPGPRPEPVAVEDDGQVVASEGGPVLRALASAAAAVTGVVLLLVPNAGGTLDIAGLAIADGAAPTAPAIDGASTGGQGTADAPEATTADLQHVHLAIPRSADPGPVLVQGTDPATPPGSIDTGAGVPSLDVSLVVPDLGDTVGEDVVPADPDDLAVDEPGTAPTAPDTGGDGVAEEGDATSVDDGTPASGGDDPEGGSAAGSGVDGDGTDDPDGADPEDTAGSSDLIDPLIVEDGAGHAAG